MTVPRILFVDDEPNVLGGLRNRLRPYRNRWEMTFVESGELALEALASSRFDAIVTDMRMPKMDGNALLARVQRDHPEVVRIVLSGHADMEASRHSVPSAHQFLAKPCDARVLEGVLERALGLRDLVRDPGVQRVVGRIESLPAIPATYASLRAQLAAPGSSAADAARIVSQDPAVCAKLLQMVNSAFFGLPRKVSRVEDAMIYLGLERIAAIVLAGEMFSAARWGGGAGFSLEQLQHSSLVAARIAATFLPPGPDREAAYTAGLLHDVGKLVLATHLEDHLRRAFADAACTGDPVYVAEARLYGVTHAEIGAYLLGLWGLPFVIVEAVANHHAPRRVPQQTFGVLAAVHVANALGHAAAGDARWSVDLEYLGTLGVSAEQWDRWRAAGAGLEVSR